MNQPHVFVADWLIPDFAMESEAFQKANVSWSLPAWTPPPPPREVQHQQLLERIVAAPRIDAVLFILAPLDSDVIDALPSSCKLLQRVGTGLDTVDLDSSQRRGMMVKNTPNYCIEEVAVHATSMILSLHRQLDTTQRMLLDGKWSSLCPKPLERLSTLTLGLVGLGRIGRRMAETMRPLVGRVVYHDPLVKEAPDWAQHVALDDLFQQSDLISLHCPLTPDTHHLIGTRTLSLMKPTAILVNVARGGLIDPAALAAALNEERLAGAGVDVYEPEVLPADSPLRSCRNAILTSHTAWYSRQAVLDARNEAIQYVLAALRTGGR